MFFTSKTQPNHHWRSIIGKQHMYHTLDRITKKILPVWLYQRLIGDWDKGGFKKYSSNTSWLFMGKIFSLTVSFFMIAVVARYLGPENLGKLSYAQSFVAIFSVFASLGINQILLRDIVSHPDKETEILGTAFLIKITFGSITTLVTATIAFLTSVDATPAFLILILSLSFILEPFGLTSTVFNARVKAKYTVITQIIISVIIPLIKLIIIFFGKGIIFFALIIVFEILMNAILSLFFYIKIFHHNPVKWKIDFKYGKKLINNSLPMLFAGVSGYLFSRIDQVMLLHMIGPISVGLYQGAVQVTDMLAGFIPGIIIASLVPALINAKNSNLDSYFNRLKQLIIFIFLLSVTIISLIVLLAPWIVGILYGNDFNDSVSILYIYVWSSLLYMIVVILQQHLINENKTDIFLFLSVSTAFINIILNLLFIPIFGTKGAALTTIISLIAYLILPLFIQSTRKDYRKLFFGDKTT